MRAHRRAARAPRSSAPTTGSMPVTWTGSRRAASTRTHAPHVASRTARCTKRPAPTEITRRAPTACRRARYVHAPCATSTRRRPRRPNREAPAASAAIASVTARGARTSQSAEMRSVRAPAAASQSAKITERCATSITAFTARSTCVEPTARAGSCVRSIALNARSSRARWWRRTKSDHAARAAGRRVTSIPRPVSRTESAIAMSMCLRCAASRACTRARRTGRSATSIGAPIDLVRWLPAPCARGRRVRRTAERVSRAAAWCASVISMCGGVRA